ncbi:pore-forming ESAT-6 family protein [Falsigemmobacter faecalis]|uniref:Uncharacterized protein n=1 Tax=Falsigemmobacter faecalis TaxID=2488730 RepID=A0A3P3DV27_9RHOB|nr:pore-forming ESAT-6 family protein [Falsigemmobacter faecalis]RRH78035.1 hypothetical protein EG244_03170 [Falsigemmobacter faecalis]
MIGRFYAKVAALVLVAGAASAQAPGMDEAVAAAKNQLGVLEFCQAEGHIDGKAVEIQKKMFGQLPAPTDAAKVEAAYEKGKAGTVSAMGVEQSLKEASASQNTDISALCKQMAAVITQTG